MAADVNSLVLAPELAVRVNGMDLSPQAATDIITATVLLDVDAPSMFALTLNNWDSSNLEFSWSEDDTFAVGHEVEIGMGYVDDQVTLIVGEITGIELEFRSDEAPILTVRGFDRRHRLARGRKTRSYANSKDSDIASQIASDADLTVEAEDTGIVHNYLLQHNQSDMEFLMLRAKRIGFEVIVEDKTLKFRSRQNVGDPTLTLDRDADLLEFYVKLSSVDQVNEVSVRGWDPTSKDAIVGRASVGDERTLMGGSLSGPGTANEIFDEVNSPVVREPTSSQAEADQLAFAKFNGMALGHIVGEGACVGRNDLRAGMVIEITGMGRRLSGLYYVTTSHHSYTPLQGYRTAFTLRRNAT